MDTSDPAHAARQALLAYWLKHPHAADTLEGISEWWLRDPSLSTAALDSALRWLTERGVVTVHQATDGRVRYSLTDPGVAPRRVV